jgi:hypothetical protein
MYPLVIEAYGLVILCTYNFKVFMYLSMGYIHLVATSPHISNSSIRWYNKCIKVYALEGGSFSTDAPLLKSPYGSVQVAISFDIINLAGNYIVVNEFKNPYENNLFYLFFNVHVKKIKIQIHPKMIMIWIYKNMVHFKPFKSP